MPLKINAWYLRRIPRVIVLILQKSVEIWLDNLRLGQYKQLFKSEGYSTKEGDFKNLKGFDLQSVGIIRNCFNYVCTHVI